MKNFKNSIIIIFLELPINLLFHKVGV